MQQITQQLVSSGLMYMQIVVSLVSLIACLPARGCSGTDLLTATWRGCMAGARLVLAPAFFSLERRSGARTCPRLALPRRCGSPGPGVPVGGHLPSSRAKTASRESSYPADPPIDAAEETAADGRNEEDSRLE
jgi:hypothetical protein